MIEIMLHLYTYEGCPFCACVRAALDALAIAAVVLPCPRGGCRFRPRAQSVGGRQQFPLLADDKTAAVIYESVEIVAYLRAYYGPGGRYRAGPAYLGECGRRAANEAPDWLGESALPELFSNESSPDAQRIRRLLCAEERPYVLRSVDGLPATVEAPDWLRAATPAGVALDRPPVPTWIDAAAGVAGFEGTTIAGLLRRRDK